MSTNKRQQVIIMGLLLLLLAIVSTALVFSLLRQQQAASHESTETVVPAADVGVPVPIPTIAPTGLITPEAHGQVLAELEAARMLAAEEKKRAQEQESTLAALNERLIKEDAARREAEKQAAELRARLDTLAAEMAALEQRRQQLAKERERIESTESVQDPIVVAEKDAEKQRIEQLIARRAALEAEVAAAEARHLKSLEQQLDIEEEIIRRGGSLTIRAPHDRRREAIRLRDQIRQSSSVE